MNVVDILLCIPLIWGAYKGFTKGLVVEVFSLVALILGIYGGIYFSNYVATLLIDNFDFNNRYTPIISFAITFIAIIILIFVLAKLVEKSVKAIALGFVNKLSGSVFGILKMAFILSVIILLINTMDKRKIVFSPDTQSKSVLYPPISKIAPFIIPNLKNLYDNIPSTLEQAKENV